MKLLSDQVSEQEVAIILRELDRVLKNNVPGDVVEFGCYVGTTSIFLQKTLQHTNKRLHVYDSFEGLPEKTEPDISPAGEQFKKGELLATKNQLIKNFKRSGLKLPIIHKGWFSRLSDEDVPSKVAFAYLDGDYYQSILDPLKLLWNKLASGAIIVIDDYQNEQLPGVGAALETWGQAHSFKLKVEKSLAIINVQ